MVPGAPAGASRGAVPSSSRRPFQNVIRGIDAASTTAAGVRARQPRSSSVAAMRSRFRRPIRTITVSEPGATAPRIGSKASAACPDTTVNPAASPRCVTGMPAAAGAATAAVTPGTTSNGMPAARSASASSPPRPSRNGSPFFNRTTRLPRRAPRISTW